MAWCSADTGGQSQNAYPDMNTNGALSHLVSEAVLQRQCSSVAKDTCAVTDRRDNRLLSILWSCPISAFNRALSQSEFLASRTRYPPLHTAFVTSFASGLPAGRPIKCYTYGPPCVSSLDLQRYCQGLVVSTVHNNDVVPTLSLGLLRDLKTTAMNLHEDRQNGTTQEIIGRVVGLWRSKVSQEQARRGEPPSSSPLKIAGYGIGSLYDPSGEERQVALTGAEIAAGRGDNRALDPAYVDPLLGEQDASDELVTNDYLWSVMRTLRASNDNDKLYPPGDVRMRLSAYFGKLNQSRS